MRNSLIEWTSLLKTSHILNLFLKKETSNALRFLDVIKRTILSNVIVLSKKKSSQSYDFHVVLLFLPKFRKIKKEARGTPKMINIVILQRA